MNEKELTLDQKKIKKIRLAIYREEKENEKSGYSTKDPEMVKKVKKYIMTIVDQR